MRKFVIRGGSGIPLSFVVKELFGGHFIIVGGSQAELSVEEVVKCVCRRVRNFQYGVSPVFWVTPSSDSITGKRLIRPATLNNDPDPGWVELCSPIPWEHQNSYVQVEVLACEAVLADPHVPGELD